LKTFRELKRFRERANAERRIVIERGTNFLEFICFRINSARAQSLSRTASAVVQETESPYESPIVDVAALEGTSLPVIPIIPIIDTPVWQRPAEVAVLILF